MNIRGLERIKFKDGSKVKFVDNSRYLGCLLNSCNKPDREIGKRIADVFCSMEEIRHLLEGHNYRYEV